MQTQITFRHFKGQHPELQKLAEETANGFLKFEEKVISTNIEFIKDKDIENDKKCEITVQIQGATLKAAETSDDLQKSLNAAADKIVRQIRKQKTKKISSSKKAPKDIKEELGDFYLDDDDNLDFDLDNILSGDEDF